MRFWSDSRADNLGPTADLWVELAECLFYK